ncbi:DUF6471 domain-containing protein [Oricola sp.]
MTLRRLRQRPCGQCNVKKKLSRGKFTAAFMLQCLEAVGSRTLHLN